MNYKDTLTLPSNVVRLSFLGDCVVLLDVPNVVKHDFLIELIALRPDCVVCAYCVKVRRTLFVGP